MALPSEEGYLPHRLIPETLRKLSGRAPQLRESVGDLGPQPTTRLHAAMRWHLKRTGGRVADRLGGLRVE